MPLQFMGYDSIGGANNVNSKEPQRANNILLYVTGLNLSVSGTAPSSNVNTNVLSLALDSFPIPKNESNVVTLNYLNEDRKFAGKTQHGNISVVFKDFVTAEVSAALWAWRQMVYDPTSGKVGWAMDYKKNGWIDMYAPDGTSERQIDIYGMWISAYDPGESDMASDDYVKITCTIEIDKWIPDASYTGKPVGARTSTPIGNGFTPITGVTT